MEEVKKQGTESLFVPYKIALELKDLGFNEECFAWYNMSQDNLCFFGDDCCADMYAGEESRPEAPLWQQAFRFFREKYGLHYIICKNIQMDGYGYREVILIPYMEENENTIFKTYEEAELACIKKLIEIAKEQNVK